MSETVSQVLDLARGQSSFILCWGNGSDPKFGVKDQGFDRLASDNVFEVPIDKELGPCRGAFTWVDLLLLNFTDGDLLIIIDDGYMRTLLEGDIVVVQVESQLGEPISANSYQWTMSLGMPPKRMVTSTNNTNLQQLSLIDIT